MQCVYLQPSLGGGLVYLQSLANCLVQKVQPVHVYQVFSFLPFKPKDPSNTPGAA